MLGKAWWVCAREGTEVYAREGTEVYAREGTEDVC